MSVLPKKSPSKSTDIGINDLLDSSSTDGLLEKVTFAKAIVNHSDLSATGWSTWESLAGPLKYPPSVVCTEPGVLYAFAVMDDDLLYVQRYSSTIGDWWGFWLPMGPEDDTHLTSKPAAVSWASNRIDVFVLGLNGCCMHLYWDIGVNLPAWDNLGNNLKYPPSVVSWGPRRLDVFSANMTTGQLVHRAWDGTWHDWEAPLQKIVVSEISAVSWGPRRLDIFALQPETPRLQNLAHISYDGTKWAFDEPVDAYGATPPTAVCWGPNRIDVFAGTVAWQGTLFYHWAWDGSSWSLGYIRPPAGIQVSANQTTSLCSWAAGRLDLVALLQGTCYHKYWEGSWSDWDNLGGTFGEDQLTCATWGVNRLDIFGVRPDKGCQYISWS